MPNPASAWTHHALTRRTAIQAGAIGLLGMGTNHLQALRAAAKSPATRTRSCIFIFLSGGLAQHDSFDMKPDAQPDVRGEFKPIATATPGLQICEHLPMLAARSERWALCRSLSHPSNEHSAGHHIMLTGRTMLPPGFNASTPRSTDWPSIAAVANYALGEGRVRTLGSTARRRPANNLPPAIVLPERLVHNSGRVIPGQFAGEMGSHRNPMFIEASPFHPKSYGAFPNYAFDHQERGDKDGRQFQAPNLSLPEPLRDGRFSGRVDLLATLERQRRELDQFAQTENFDRHRQDVISMLTDSRVQQAFDVTKASDAEQDLYGRNSFGWSLLMARRLVESGVELIQVNLGNNESWDTHGEAFPHLKDKLLPPTDRAVSGLLDDLKERGLLDSTLIVMAGEFGRTPKITHLPKFYKQPGRDHWGAVQSVFFAGGGVRGGTVIGSSDRLGAYPASSPQTPENFAATIYQSLGIPPTASWHDHADRPHQIYHGDPIPGLMG